MKDPRYKELAHLLVHYSCRVQPGENVLIEQRGYDDALAHELVQEVKNAGAHPFVRVWSEKLERDWLMHADRETFATMARHDAALMKEMQAYIAIRQKTNLYNMNDLTAEQLRDYTLYYEQPVHFEQRIPHTKWVVMRYPNPSMAQLAEMPTEEFEDFYFRVCNFDYEKLSRAMDPLQQLLQNGKQVKIIGKNVDLSFSIEGIPAIKCDGKMNIPDGEVYTAPVKDSVQGYITYNTPSPDDGRVFEAVHLELENGRIVKAGCAGGEEASRAVNAILDTDEGARYIGEFALGVHPYITKPMKDTLFDEKIAGSFHFTPGNAYDDADNGNRSSVHWDMVYMMQPEYGGAEIYVDGELIQKDGRFVKKELEGLNPENFDA